MESEQHKTQEQLQAIATLAIRDRAMAYWTDARNFPTDTDRLFWQIVGQ
ncbi:hypothetical protein Curie_18 [Microbacterium phage Curie]